MGGWSLPEAHSLRASLGNFLAIKTIASYLSCLDGDMMQNKILKTKSKHKSSCYKCSSQLYTHYLCVWITGLDEEEDTEDQTKLLQSTGRGCLYLLLQINWALALQYSLKGCTVQREEGAAVSYLSSNDLHCRGGVQQGLVGVGQAVLIRAAEPILCSTAAKQTFEQVDFWQQKALDKISMSLPAFLSVKNWH